MDRTIHDILHGLRLLRKAPGFTAVALITLAFAVGANTAIFSVVNSVLLKPLPVKDGKRLMTLTLIANQRMHQSEPEYLDFSYPDFLDYRDQQSAFTEMLGYDLSLDGLTFYNHTDHIIASYVTGNFFSALNIQPELGRLIIQEEEHGGDVVVLGYSAWKKHFGGDPQITGKTVLFDGRPMTVIGVVPQNFHGLFPILEMDAYVPFGVKAYRNPELWTARNRHELRVFAYLKPDATIGQARAEMNLIASRLAKQYPETDKDNVVDVFPERLARPQPSAAPDWPLMVTLFLSLAFIVLLVGCVNLVNLLLARANMRSGEMAVRAALGATRIRLIRQLLAESVLLALLGGAAGLIVARASSTILARISQPNDIPIKLDFSFDWRVFAYALIIIVVSGIGIGLLPALRASRRDLNTALHESGRTAAGGTRRQRARKILVAGQIAGCFALLVIAGLFIRILEKAQHRQLGYNPQNVLTVSMDVADVGLGESSGRAFYNDVMERVRALPGVEAATYSYARPFGIYHEAAPIFPVRKTYGPGEQPPTIFYDDIAPNYFATMQASLAEGRPFVEADDESMPRVAIVNQEMARRLWPGEDPIGRRFRLTANGPLTEIVGVAGNAWYVNPTAEPEPHFYLPLSQHYKSRRVLYVRSLIPFSTLAPEVQREIHARLQNLPLEVRSMQEALQGANGFFLFHVASDLAGALGLIGFVLAVVGVYGVVSYSATTQTHEIGIRIALGARQGEILKMVLSEGATLVALGSLIGLIVVRVATGAISSFLVGIDPGDPLTFATAALLLGGATLLASYLPALRATRIVPMEALRHE